MKRRILPILLAVLCLVMLLSVTAYAEPLDTAADTSLTLYYQKEGTPFPGLDISVYRIAEAYQTGAFALIAPFNGYPISIHGITEQSKWQQLTSTLNAYIVADGLTPNAQSATDETGTAHFTGLPTGLYYVEEAVAETSDGTYVFNRFLVYLPTPLSNGTYNYQVEAKPKCTEFIPKTEYTVTKLWQDGNASGSRPGEVTVEIYKDGQLFHTQSLNTSNNWTYTWSVSGQDQSQWTVAERPVPKEYTVTIQQNGNHFTVINAHQPEPETPQTGDTFTPLPWILALCFSGIMLLILGLYRRRKQ